MLSQDLDAYLASQDAEASLSVPAALNDTAALENLGGVVCSLAASIAAAWRSSSLDISSDAVGLIPEDLDAHHIYTARSFNNGNPITGTVVNQPPYVTGIQQQPKLLPGDVGFMFSEFGDDIIFDINGEVFDSTGADSFYGFNLAPPAKRINATHVIYACDALRQSELSMPGSTYYMILKETDFAASIEARRLFADSDDSFSKAATAISQGNTYIAALNGTDDLTVVERRLSPDGLSFDQEIRFEVQDIFENPSAMTSTALPSGDRLYAYIQYPHIYTVKVNDTGEALTTQLTSTGDSHEKIQLRDVVDATTGEPQFPIAMWVQGSADTIIAGQVFGSDGNPVSGANWEINFPDYIPNLQRVRDYAFATTPAGLSLIIAELDTGGVQRSLAFCAVDTNGDFYVTPNVLPLAPGISFEEPDIRFTSDGRIEIIYKVSDPDTASSFDIAMAEVPVGSVDANTTRSAQEDIPEPLANYLQVTSLADGTLTVNVTGPNAQLLLNEQAQQSVVLSGSPADINGQLTNNVTLLSRERDYFGNYTLHYNYTDPLFSAADTLTIDVAAVHDPVAVHADFVNSDQQGLIGETLQVDLDFVFLAETTLTYVVTREPQGTVVDNAVSDSMLTLTYADTPQDYKITATDLEGESAEVVLRVIGQQTTPSPTPGQLPTDSEDGLFGLSTTQVVSLGVSGVAFIVRILKVAFTGRFLERCQRSLNQCAPGEPSQVAADIIDELFLDDICDGLCAETGLSQTTEMRAFVKAQLVAAHGRLQDGQGLREVALELKQPGRCKRVTCGVLDFIFGCCSLQQNDLFDLGKRIGQALNTELNKRPFFYSRFFCCSDDSSCKPYTYRYQDGDFKRAWAEDTIKTGIDNFMNAFFKDLYSRGAAARSNFDDEVATLGAPAGASGPAGVDVEMGPLDADAIVPGAEGANGPMGPSATNGDYGLDTGAGAEADVSIARDPVSGAAFRFVGGTATTQSTQRAGTYTEADNVLSAAALSSASA